MSLPSNHVAHNTQHVTKMQLCHSELRRSEESLQHD
jgi:hypothetical protein